VLRELATVTFRREDGM